MADILKASRATITIQEDTTAFPAGTNPNEAGYSAVDAPVVIDNRNTETGANGKGADYLYLELDVTTGPAAEGVAEIWYSQAEDDAQLKWSKWKHSHTVGDAIIISAVDHYDAGLFVLNARYTKLAVVASTQAFNANLIATPKYYATT